MGCTRYLAAILLALGIWTESGESSNPQLTRAELPVDVLNDCAAVAIDSIAVCTDDNFRIGWIGRTPRGHLFVVERAACGGDACRAWLVTKDEAGMAHILLAVTGDVRLERGPASFPAVRTRTELADNYTSYARFEWTGGRYARTQTRLLHRIDGFECASDSECESAAREAMRRNEPDRAVRIWQQVYGVGWI